MNAPFALTRQKIRVLDLHRPDEAARVERFVAQELSLIHI